MRSGFVSEKKIFLYLLLLLSHYLLHAQAGMWTWMKGDNAYNAPGNFGIQGVAAASNNPPSVYAPFCWTDLQGRFWLLGGDNVIIKYADLWMFDLSTNNWTWVKGTGIANQAGVYGTLGIPSAANFPGSRSSANTTWTDNSGDLWLFGGYGCDANGSIGALNDLWKYTIATNEWTWMAGTNGAGAGGIYGTYQVPSANNTPGGRWETGSAWKDNDGNLWMFGGGPGYNFANDMWKFDLSLNQWAWMSGSSITTGLPPVYGSLGISSALNTPGGRTSYCKWVDQEGNFLTFGGNSDGILDVYADLWKYNPVTNEWAWMSGINTGNSSGSWGNFCESNEFFFPAARFENRSSWVDQNETIWMYGGFSYLFGSDIWADLWAYRSDSNDWTLVSGTTVPNQSPFYGIQGVASVLNHPGSKAGSASWMDQNNNLWLFGGFHSISPTLKYTNDLWKYQIDSACPVQVSIFNQVNFSVSSSQLCEKFCVNFYDSSSNNPVSWQWQFPGGVPSTSTTQNPANICYNNPGTYDVTLITTNANGNDTLTLSGYITVFPTPDIPAISQTGYTLTSTTASNYQWQFNNVNIPGATDQSYAVMQTGYYTVVITDQNGCSSSSSTQYVLITGLEEIFSDGNVVIYPNPSDGNFIVELFNCLIADRLSIEIVNTLGEVVFSSEEKISSSNYKRGIDLSNAPHRVYFVEIKSENIYIREMIVIAR